MSKNTPPTGIAPLFTWRSAVCQSDLTATQRHVALTLSLYMNERGGSAFPGAKRLADDTSLHVSTIRRSLKELADLGWLELRQQGGVKGERKRANEYVATRPDPTLDDVAPPAQDDGSQTTTGSTGRTTPRPPRTRPLAQDDPSTSYEVTSKSPSGASADADAVDDAFEKLWKVYPPTNGVKREKADARKAFGKMSWDDRRAAYRGAIHKAAHFEATGEQPPYLVRFLKRRDFEDFQQPVNVDRNGNASQPVEACPDCNQLLSSHDDDMCERTAA